MLEFVVILLVMNSISTALAVSAYRRAGKLATRVDLAKIERQMADIVEDHSALIQSHKKLRSRIGMRELREKREAQTIPPDESPEEWKKRVRLELVTGKRNHDL